MGQLIFEQSFNTQLVFEMIETKSKEKEKINTHKIKLHYFIDVFSVIRFDSKILCHLHIWVRYWLLWRSSTWINIRREKKCFKVTQMWDVCYVVIFKQKDYELCASWTRNWVKKGSTDEMNSFHFYV